MRSGWGNALQRGILEEAEGEMVPVLVEMVARCGWVLGEEIKASVVVDGVVNLGQGQPAQCVPQSIPQGKVCAFHDRNSKLSLQVFLAGSRYPCPAP